MIFSSLRGYLVCCADKRSMRPPSTPRKENLRNFLDYSGHAVPYGSAVVGLAHRTPRFVARNYLTALCLPLCFVIFSRRCGIIGQCENQKAVALCVLEIGRASRR